MSGQRSRWCIIATFLQIANAIIHPLSTVKAIIKHQKALSQCRQCPDMIPPVITGRPVLSKILLVGQAPGIKEGDLGRPFGWTAGKTLFKWFDSIGLDEEQFRSQVYMSAVCRCFPGKNPKGGDRVPNQEEIEKCSVWINKEIALIKPQLIIPVGKLAIAQYMPVDKLVDVIGKKTVQHIGRNAVDIIPLPHPSGASTWHRMEPGATLLKKALAQIKKHAAWKALDKKKR